MFRQGIANELQHELGSTKKMLERVPVDKFDWKPHEKSMSLGRLAGHIAEIWSWLTMTIKTDELDLAAMNYQPPVINETADLLNLLEKTNAEAIQAVQNASHEDLMKTWTLRRGDQTLMSMPKVAVIRSLAMNHLVHHRGQLSVYLRMLDIPVPGMYGPSADDRF